MNVARAVLVHGGHVRLRAVALVCRKPVLWPPHMGLMHHAVARDLGDDGRRGDGETLGIALDDRLDVVGVDMGGGAVAVDEDGRGGGPRQAPHGGLHRAVRRLEDVDLVDALCVLNASAAGLGGSAGGLTRRRSAMVTTLLQCHGNYACSHQTQCLVVVHASMAKRAVAV